MLDTWSEVTVCDQKETERDVDEESATGDGAESLLLEETRSLCDELITAEDASKAENLNFIKYHLHVERGSLKCSRNAKF